MAANKFDVKSTPVFALWLRLGVAPGLPIRTMYRLPLARAAEGIESTICW
jgi:hypothetical protein